MHRRIHKLFTLGFLADIEARNDPVYADQGLWTQLEIILKPDGSVDRVGIVRHSALLAFDTAAIDSVTSAAPFPPPPEAIKSADGRVHLDWQFHRDERACGAFGTTPHIFTSDWRETPEVTAAAVAQLMARQKPDLLALSVSEPRVAAEGWFAAFFRRDPAWLAGWSATPFTADGEVIAREGATLKKFYGEMIAGRPADGSAPSELNLLTASEIQRERGQLPRGGEPSQMLFAVGSVAGTKLILLLKKSSQGWRVCGIDRQASGS